MIWLNSKLVNYLFVRFLCKHLDNIILFMNVVNNNLNTHIAMYIIVQSILVYKYK